MTLDFNFLCQVQKLMRVGFSKVPELFLSSEILKRRENEWTGMIRTFSEFSEEISLKNILKRPEL